MKLGANLAWEDLLEESWESQRESASRINGFLQKQEKNNFG